MIYIALDELDVLQSRTRLFGKSRFSLYSFNQSDHLPGTDEESSLPERVRQFARSAGLAEEIFQIRLLTNVRVLGYVFNPVSFFFCFSRAGEPIGCVAEVGNTFGEKKAYLLRYTGGGKFCHRQQKLFYVSPFTELDQDLVFDLSLPAEKLDLHVDTMDGQTMVVSASVVGTRQPFTDANLSILSLRYPLAPARVLALIHLHALLLCLKKTPHHMKGESMEQQVAVMNPHDSLRSTARRLNRK